MYVVADPMYQDTSGSAPHFVLATGGNDNLVKLWDIFTASGMNWIFYFVLVFGCDSTRNRNMPGMYCR